MTSQGFRSRVASLLRELDEPGRAAFSLRFGFADGYTYTIEEVGQILRLGVASARKEIRGAREDLLARLAAKGGVSIDEFDGEFPDDVGRNETT